MKSHDLIFDCDISYIYRSKLLDIIEGKITLLSQRLEES